MIMSRHKKQVLSQLYDLPVSLFSADGKELQTFPSEVVSSMRHVENALRYSNALPKTLAMVSALSGEGVTYTSLAFACTLANDLQAKVCLVELNWHTPGLYKYIMEGSNLLTPKRGKKHRSRTPVTAQPDFRPGVAEVLTGKCSIEEVSVSTSISNLTLLPAGFLDAPLRASMARSEELQQLLVKLSEQFDNIILDIPAIHLSKDATSLAALSQGCCIVIRQSITPIPQIQRALQEISFLNILGAILNQSTLETPNWLRNILPQE